MRTIATEKCRAGRRGRIRIFVLLLLVGASGLFMLARATSPGDDLDGDGMSDAFERFPMPTGSAISGKAWPGQIR
jgi:hypothetical protein